MTRSSGNRTAAYLLAVLDHVPSFVAVVDRDLRCRFANAPALQWLGATDRGRVIGRRLDEVLPPDIYRSTLPHAHAALAGEERSCRHRFVDKVGATRDIKVIYTPKRIGGHVDGFYVSVTEMDDQTGMERATGIEPA